MKSVYFEAIDGMIVISGIYKGDSAARPGYLASAGQGTARIWAPA
jgi:hypothetical protein